MAIEIKYIPLSFINTDDEILKQIKNTVLFSYLFQNFKETSLSNYLESTQYGYTASASEIGTHKLVRITDINSGNVNWDTVPFCDCDSEGKYLLKDNDILVARTGGTTGKSFIVKSAPKNAIFASYLIRLRLKKDVNLEFITLYLNSYTFWSQIVEMKSGSAMPNVNAEKLKTLIIPKLSLKEQNDFVSAFKNSEKTNENHNIFDKIEEVESLFVNSKVIVNELTHQINLIKQLRQAFLREAMQGRFEFPKQPLTEAIEGNGFETGQQLLTKIKAEKAQLIKAKKLKAGLASSQSINLISDYKIPTNWKWCKADEIFFITKLAGFEYSEHIKLSEHGEIPVVRAQNVRPLNIEKKNLLYIDRQISELLERCALTKKCLLVTFIGAGIGDVATFEEDVRWHLAPNVAKMEPFIGCEDLLSVKFINYFMMSDIGQKEIFKHVKATAQPSLSMGTIRDIDIPLPPLHEQEQIVTKLEELMAFCDGLEQSIKESQGYNEMLLQQVLREALQGEEV